MSPGLLRDLALNLVVMLLSLSVHEFAHAFAADRLGDDTPRRQGRLTLSPMAHYDLFGTFLVPIVATFLSGFALIGWARPVQFVPANLTRKVSMKTGTMIVAVAGPLSNLVLAVAAIAVLAVIDGVSPGALLVREPGPLGAALTLMKAMFYVNVALFIFNLLPLPPLDGSRLLPRRFDELQASIAPYSFIILLVLINVDTLRHVLFETPVAFVVGSLETVFGTHVWGF